MPARASSDDPRIGGQLHDSPLAIGEGGVVCYLGERSESMDAGTMKDKIIETVRSLPDDATVEDAMERLLFLAKLERGLQESDGSDTITHDEIKKRFLK